MPKTAIVLSTQFLQASSIYSQEKTNLANTIFEGKRCPALRTIIMQMSFEIQLDLTADGSSDFKSKGVTQTHSHKFDQVSTLVDRGSREEGGTRPGDT